MRPRALVLFAGEGGEAYGYKQAGYDVTAVDDVDRPNRAPGITWHTGDATTWPLDGYDLIAGGPPCTDHSTLRTVAEVKRKGGGAAGTGWMLQHTLDRFREHSSRTGVPWVIENVEGAKADMPNPIKLCGSMFGLIDDGWLLRRHRYFASSAFLMAPGPCRCHGRKIIGVYGELSVNDRRCAGKRITRPNGDRRAGVERARRLMGMPWASAEGLTLAIPPAYTQHIGEQILFAHSVIAGPGNEKGPVSRSCESRPDLIR
jgi:DNA (cytosine-5)-methyltransferase 1